MLLFSLRNNLRKIGQSIGNGIEERADQIWGVGATAGTFTSFAYATHQACTDRVKPEHATGLAISGSALSIFGSYFVAAAPKQLAFVLAVLGGGTAAGVAATVVENKLKARRKP